MELRLSAYFAGSKKQERNIRDSTGDVGENVGADGVALLEQLAVGAEGYGTGMVGAVVESVADLTVLTVSMVTAEVSREFLLPCLQILTVRSAEVKEVSSILQLG